MLKEIHWVSMYSNVYDVRLWRTSRFCFDAFSFLYRRSCWARMFLTNTNLLFFWFRCCCSVGPEVFAFSPSVPCVNLCYYEWALVFIHLLHRTCRMILREANAETKSGKEEKSREENDAQGWSETNIQQLKNPVINHPIRSRIMDNIINQTKHFWERITLTMDIFIDFY